ncbi:Outer membrane lipoprotein OmlA [Paramagnetospirillum magnetotacticum MS-1]|uniref:Outer membrane lipoprotein OmlA n=1 Tax=Paramagnetospirillum magnetotacticum MS-1 TaxID=272627 RepID=A0A0C2YUJ2_PARME|nr:outer membrane protein assembly factor BamE [Paramagnetospirillum magnetotacticum]KIL98793.1 Outer membrane lipoprotein OmlA [Paramagnetospirillum magnetotacticum MS-1]
MKKTSVSHRFLLVAALVAVSAACTPIIEVRGNLPPPEQLAQVKIGTSTREDVQALLGTPSNVTPFGEESWHYISAITEREAFFEPEVKERKVITVVFDRAGTVRAIDNRGLEDGKDVVPAGRETPTAGKELTILQQLMGNVGRFSKPAQGK